MTMLSSIKAIGAADLFMRLYRLSTIRYLLLKSVSHDIGASGVILHDFTA